MIGAFKQLHCPFTPKLLIICSLIAFLAGFVKGIAGFGFAIVFTPLTLLVLHDPRLGVFVALVLGALMSVGVIVEVRNDIKIASALPVITGTVLGTPLGILLLLVIHRPTLKAAISALAVGLTILRLFRLEVRLGQGIIPLMFGTFLGGVLNGCTSMGGPVPVMIVSWQRRAINESRAILVVFNLLSYLIAIAMASATGIAKMTWLAYCLWLFAPAVLGTIAGAHAVRRISSAAFANVITIVVGFGGIVGLISILK